MEVMMRKASAAKQTRTRAPRHKVNRLIPPTAQSAWTTIQGWCALTGMSDGATYNAMSRGDLVTRKLGKRVLIDVEKGLAWLNSLPPATIRLARAPRREPAVEASATP
jgi:hypothetical protein